MYAIRSYYVIDDVRRAAEDAHRDGVRPDVRAVELGALVVRAAPPELLEELLASVDPHAVDVLRITSYNVCYTKLLRRSITSLNHC